jgi:selenocysteine-specific elongation factor
VLAALEDVGLKPSAVIATSAPTKQGIVELERALVELSDSVQARGESARVWLPVDRVFSIKGAGTVVTGTLTRGRIAVGDTRFVAGEREVIEASCRGLEIHGSVVSEAQAPTRVAANLGRVALADISRGDVVTKDRDLPRSRHIGIVLRALPGSERELPRTAAC